MINTYINEVSGVENIRDLVAQQILFSPAQTLDVHMLDDHLQGEILYGFMDSFYITVINTADTCKNILSQSLYQCYMLRNRAFYLLQ